MLHRSAINMRVHLFAVFVAATRYILSAIAGIYLFTQTSREVFISMIRFTLFSLSEEDGGLCVVCMNFKIQLTEKF